jgi:outer membrane protein
MKIKLTGMMIIAFFLTLQLAAQEQKTLSLKDAIELSLTNSKQLKVSLAKIDEARGAVVEAAQKKLPDATASGSYLRLNSANVDIKTKNNNSSGTPNETPKVTQAVYGIINLSMPLFAGGRIKYGIQSAYYLAQAAKLDAEDDKDEVIQNSIEAFANLFKATTAVRLVQENLQQAQQRAKDFANLEQNGILPRNDLLKAQLQSSNVELNLLDAQNNLQLANVNMDLMLGLPTTTELVLDTVGIEKKDDYRPLEDFVQLAITNRKDLQATGMRKKAAQTGIKTVQAEKYPSISLTGGYIAADIPNVFSVTNAVNIGLGVSYNIGSLWKNKAKVDQAEARVKQIVATESMMDDNIRLQVNKTYFSLVSNRKKIEVYSKAVEQAEENYRIVKNKFDNSLATTTDLLDADVAQLQARLSYTLARADTFVAYNKLLQVAGSLSDELIKTTK